MNKRFYILVAAFLLLSFSGFAQRLDVMDEVAANPQKSYGTDFPYSFDAPALTKAPRGYKPFYVSMYARHGSRYYWASYLYTELDSLLTKGHRLGTLTAEGESFYSKFTKAYPELVAGTEELSRLGWNQHCQLARTMYDNFPSVFSKGGTVSAISSLTGRCVVSMAAFCQELKACNPELSIYEQSSRSTLHGVVPTDRSNPLHRDFPRKETNIDLSIIPVSPVYPSDEAVVARVFKTTEGLGKDAKAIRDELKNLYTSLPSIGHAGMMGSILNDSEIAAGWELANAQAYISFSRNRYDMIPVLEDILDRAEAVIDGSDDDVASLRFGHDGCLGPLTVLMGVNGADREITDARDIKYWYQNFQTCKASNLQFVFYRSNRSNDVLVKCLLNGFEATLPLPGDNAPYYKWSDFSSYYRGLCDKF